MPDPPSSPPPRLLVPLELRACPLQRTSSVLSGYSTATSFFNSPNLRCSVAAMTNNHHTAQEIAARLITPISASDLAVRRTRSSLVCFAVSLCSLVFFPFRLLRTSVIDRFMLLVCTGSSFSSAVLVESGFCLFCDVTAKDS